MKKDTWFKMAADNAERVTRATGYRSSQQMSSQQISSEESENRTERSFFHSESIRRLEKTASGDKRRRKCERLRELKIYRERADL